MSQRTWTGATSGDWAVTGNWQEGSVPINGDDVVIPAGSVSITASLNQSAVTLNSLTILSAYTGLIGLATTYLQIGAATCTIGGASGSSQAGSGSQRLMLNFGAAQMTTTILGTCNVSADAGLEPIRILGSHASNKLYMVGTGRVGVATTLTSETATLTEFNVSGGGSLLNLGAGCTLTTGNISAGTATARSAMTTLTMAGGTLTTTGSGAIATATLRGAAPTFYSNSTGTITTFNLYTGVADFSGNPAARTLTTLNQWGGSVKAFGGNPSHLTIGTWNRNFSMWSAAATT
jgi:hypothetical protein